MAKIGVDLYLGENIFLAKITATLLCFFIGQTYFGAKNPITLLDSRTQRLGVKCMGGNCSSTTEHSQIPFVGNEGEFMSTRG